MWNRAKDLLIIKDELVLYKDSGLTQSKKISTAKTLISFPEKKPLLKKALTLHFLSAARHENAIRNFRDIWEMTTAENHDEG